MGELPPSRVRILAFLAVVVATAQATAFHRNRIHGSLQLRSATELIPDHKASHQYALVQAIRGGASEEQAEEEDEGDEEEGEEEEEEEEAEDEYDEEYDEEEEEEEAVKMDKVPMPEPEYVEPYFMTPMHSIVSTVAVLALSKRIDFFNPLVVKLARALFVVQIVLTQLLIAFVRIMAKKRNNRTPVQQKNPLSDILQSQLGGDSNGMVKSLASSFLNSQTTVMEYDIKQCMTLQSGVIINMLLMWLLHFRMQQIQPLIMTTVNSFMTLFFNPLFQVYVLGRNLERPFKNPPSPFVPPPIPESAEPETAAAATTPEEATEAVVEVTTEIVEDEEGAEIEESDEESDADEDSAEDDE